jgi:DNA repair protein RadC
LTQKLKKEASYVDMRVLDNLIVSEKGYFSFTDEEII